MNKKVFCFVSLFAITILVGSNITSLCDFKSFNSNDLKLKSDSLVLVSKKVDSLETLLKDIETSPDDPRKFKLLLFKKVQRSYTDLDKIGKKIDGAGAIGLALLCMETSIEVYPEIFTQTITKSNYGVYKGDTTQFSLKPVK